MDGDGTVVRIEGDILESVLRHAPDFLAHITAEGRFLFLNRFAAGLGPSDLQDRTIYDFTAPEDHHKIRTAIARTIETGTPQEYETVGAGPDQKTAHYFTRVAPVIVDGRVPSVVLIATDVTRLKELEANLSHSQRLDSLARLAAGIAGDFQGALTSILSSADLVASVLPADSPILRGLQDACDEARRSLALADQLLSFARKQAFEPRALDLNTLIPEIDGLLRHVLGAGIEIVVELTTRRHAKVDHGQLKQVILCLASNAREAMSGSGVFAIRTSDVDIGPGRSSSIGTVTPGAYVKLELSDTGSGIAREDLHRVFEPFYTTKEGERGRGLGLAMVYGTVTQHGGHVSVSSEPDHGTMFEILLPVAARESASADERTGGETILVAEDDAIVRASLLKVLTRAGYRVLEASSGVEALAVSRAHRSSIEMLLTDLVMPDMGGIELERNLSSERPGIATLFVSGYADERHGVIDPNVDLLPKPFPNSVLLRRVRQRLAKG